MSLLLSNNSKLLRTLFESLKLSRNHPLCTNVSTIFDRRPNYCVVNDERIRQFSTSMSSCAAHFKPRDRRDILKSVPKDDEGTEGEHSIMLGSSVSSKEDMFTDENTPNLLYDGIPFKELPIISLRCTKNNTFVVLKNFKGEVIAFRSCGLEGFKNCRKGTNVAGQSTALYVSSKAVRMGFKDVRLTVAGLGPGRMSAIKGLQMGGLNIISVTDDTKVTFRLTSRPRKVRRV